MDIPFHTALSADQQAQFGITDPWPLAMADQVRFSDLDPLNHVNNAVYMEWLERVRIRYTQLWGISRYDGAPDNPRLVLHSAQIRYVAELRMDDVYVVTERCVAFRKSSYTVAQEIWANGKLCTTFSCVLVMLTSDGAGKFPLPEPVRQRFLEIDGARDESTT